LFKIEFNSPLKNVHWIPGALKKKPFPLNFQEETKKNLSLKNLAEKQKAEEKEIKRVIEMLKKAAKEIEIEKCRMIKEGEREILKMVMAIVRKVIKREIEVDPDIIVRVTRDALGQAADARRILIKVNPLDWKRLKEIEQEILPGENNGNHHIQIEEDKSIQRGGCIIKTEKETIDARIDQQIREIEKTLMEVRGE